MYQEPHTFQNMLTQGRVVLSHSYRVEIMADE